METFICKKKFKGKDLLYGKNTTVNVGTILNRVGNILYKVVDKNSIPICSWRSQTAKDYFVWNGDGCGDERWELEKKIFAKSPFNESQIKMLREHFDYLLREDAPGVILFNDYFYTQSHLMELRVLIDRLEATSY